MPASAALGTLGCGFVAVTATLALLRVERWARAPRFAIALFAAALVIAPLESLSPAGYLRGITGDMSVTTLFLAASAASVRLGGRALIGSGERLALFRGLVVVAVLLYPFALGLTFFDVYALGYGSTALVSLLLLTTLAAWNAGYVAVVTLILLAALAYLGHAGESRNLWDYLVDPLACGYALMRLIRA